MRTIVITMLLLSSLNLFSQDYPSPPPQQTSPVNNARFEIIQSPLLYRLIFKLDRYNGMIWQLVISKDNSLTWELMLREDITPGTLDRPRFQIFTSGIATKGTFLIDSYSGVTWVLVTRKERGEDGNEYDVLSWEMIKNKTK